MKPFVIREEPGFGHATSIMRVSGFSVEEMKELSKLPVMKMEERVLEMINQRNNGIGTCWHNGNGVYRVYISQMCPDSVFVEIGKSCD